MKLRGALKLLAFIMLYPTYSNAQQDSLKKWTIDFIGGMAFSIGPDFVYHPDFDLPTSSSFAPTTYRFGIYVNRKINKHLGLGMMYYNQRIKNSSFHGPWSGPSTSSNSDAILAGVNLTYGKGRMKYDYRFNAGLSLNERPQIQLSKFDQYYSRGTGPLTYTTRTWNGDAAKATALALDLGMGYSFSLSESISIINRLDFYYTRPVFNVNYDLDGYWFPTNSSKLETYKIEQEKNKIEQEIYLIVFSLGFNYRF